jgi:hypothetical protein
VVAAFQVGRNLGFGGALATGYATSTDAGRTWRSGLLPALGRGIHGFVSDPTVAYDAVHRTWLVASLFGTTGVGSGLLVSRSPDGRSWLPPVTAASSPGSDLGFDKEWLACDASLASAHRGRCYLAYTAVFSNSLAVIASDDGGATWSEPVVAAEAAEEEEVVGAQPAVLADGRLAVVYLDGALIRSVVSRDGGASFGEPVDVATAATASVPLRPGLVLPSVEAGGDGLAHSAWVDSGPRGANDVVVSSSADGETWTQPARIRAVPGGDAFLPAVAADPVSHRLAVTAYRVANYRVDAYTITSRDGGATWTTPLRLTARSIPLAWVARAPQPFVGDYTSTEFAAGRLVPLLTLAAPPSFGLFHESVYAASLP